MQFIKCIGGLGWEQEMHVTEQSNVNETIRSQFAAMSSAFWEDFTFAFIFYSPAFAACMK